jgi:gliding motility-associated-like protein
VFKPTLKKAFYILSLLFPVSSFFGQSATAFFTAPDTVCVNQTFSVTNLCVNASTYYWSFCQGNTNVTPQAINLGNIGFFSGPVFVTMAKDGSNYYAFVNNNFNSNITRLFYGSSLLNTPVAVNLGNVSGVLPGNLEDMHLEYQGGNWYGIVTGGIPGSIARLSFGNSLGNTPTAVNLGNIGGLNYPQRIKIFNSGGNYYGFIPNRNNNTITRLSFGANISNTPTGLNLGNIGVLNTPDAIAIITIGGNWYGYVINEGSNTLTRLDFGNSLLNIPTAVNLGNTGVLNGPRAIDVWVECNQIRGLITNRYANDLLNMNFPGGPTGPVVTTSFGNIASFAFPHSIGRFRSGDTLYAFITNVNNNTMSRIYYPGCTNASIPSTTVANPPPVSYNAPGNYYINVLINEGQLTQASYCKQVTVINTTVAAVNNGPVCAGGSVTLTASGANSYTWNPGSIIGGTIVVTPTASTIYTVTGTKGMCSGIATTSVTVTPGFTLNASATSTALCGTSATLTASGATTYTWNPGNIVASSIVVTPTITTTYTVFGTSGSCIISKTLTIAAGSNPNLAIVSPGNICAGNSGTLSVSGASNYTWNPGALTGSSVIVNPASTTIYTVFASIGTCTSSAVTTLTVNPIPVINAASTPTAICSGNSATISANGATSYTWQPGNLTGNSIVVSPSVNATFSVIGTNGFCSNTETVSLTVSATPTVIATLSGSGCVGDQISLNASGPSTYNYSWSGPNGFSSTSQNPSFTASSAAYNGNYFVTADNNGCVATSSVFVGVSTYSPSQILSGITSGCEPLCISFSVQTTSSGASSWSFSDGTNASGANVIHCFTRPGTYSVNVSVDNPLGCGSYGSLNNIIVYPKPIADFNFAPIKPIIGQEVVFTDASYQSVTSWNWYFMNTPQYTSIEQNPNFIYEDAGTYPIVLVVKNDKGCSDTAIKVITVMEDYSLYIPNTFTPNGDGLNDFFQPKGFGINKYEMLIFDRWGEQIFETKDFEKGWDGKYQGKQCPSDVYIYKIKVTNVFGEAHDFPGHVNLIK